MQLTFLDLSYHKLPFKTCGSRAHEWEKGTKFHPKNPKAAFYDYILNLYEKMHSNNYWFSKS